MLLLALPLCAGAAWAEPRLAVVIGNSDYRSERLPDLPNASADADALARRLSELGFAVIAGPNATAAGMRELLRQAESETAEEALLVFFAGHAVEAGGDTLLLPADAPEPTTLRQLTDGAMRLGEVLGRLAVPGRPTLVFVDACRTRFGPPSAGVTGRQADDVFLGFSAQAGQDAMDGAGRHSPFTRALLDALVPGTDVAAAFARVRAETVRLTLGRQTPSSVSTLRRPFAFTAGAGAVPPGG